MNDRPTNARAEFEALRAAVNNAPTYEMQLSAMSDMMDFVDIHAAIIAAALPSDTAPDTLPDDWSPSPELGD